MSKRPAARALLLDVCGRTEKNFGTQAASGSVTAPPRSGVSGSCVCSQFGKISLDPKLGRPYREAVQVIARRTLKLFWTKHPQAETPLKVWYAMVSKAAWNSPADVKAQFGASVDFVADNRVIFDLSGNKYRLVAHVAYRYKRVLIKFVGTHAEYNRIDPETV